MQVLDQQMPTASSQSLVAEIPMPSIAYRTKEGKRCDLKRGFLYLQLGDNKLAKLISSLVVMTEDFLIFCILPYLTPSTFLRGCITTTSQRMRQVAFQFWISMSCDIVSEKFNMLKRCGVLSGDICAIIENHSGDMENGVPRAVEAFLHVSALAEDAYRNYANDLATMRSGIRDIIVRHACWHQGLNNKNGFEAFLCHWFEPSGELRQQDCDYLRQQDYHSQLHGAYWQSMREAKLRPFNSNNHLSNLRRAHPRPQRIRFRQHLESESDERLTFWMPWRSMGPLIGQLRHCHFYFWISSVNAS